MTNKLARLLASLLVSMVVAVIAVFVIRVTVFITTWIIQAFQIGSENFSLAVFGIIVLAASWFMIYDLMGKNE